MPSRFPGAAALGGPDRGGPPRREFVVDPGASPSSLPSAARSSCCRRSWPLCVGARPCAAGRRRRRACALAVAPSPPSRSGRSSRRAAIAAAAGVAQGSSAIAAIGGLAWAGAGLGARRDSRSGRWHSFAAALRGEGPGWLALVAPAASAVALCRRLGAPGRDAAGRAPRRARPAGAARARPGFRSRSGCRAALPRRDDIRLATGRCGRLRRWRDRPRESPPAHLRRARFCSVRRPHCSASLLCPLVVGGVLADGRWLWRGAPVADRVVGGAAGLVGCLGAAAPGSRGRSRGGRRVRARTGGRSASRLRS